jgi:hypothetical protein
MKLKINDILFWILIALILAVILWKLFGSPTDIATIIAITLFLIGSEMLIWRALFAIDKKTSLGFMKMKNDMNLLKNDINNKFDNLNNKLNNLENLIRRKK